MIIFQAFHVRSESRADIIMDSERMKYHLSINQFMTKPVYRVSTGIILSQGLIDISFSSVDPLLLQFLPQFCTLWLSTACT